MELNAALRHLGASFLLISDYNNPEGAAAAERRRCDSTNIRRHRGPFYLYTIHFGSKTPLDGGIHSQYNVILIAQRVGPIDCSPSPHK